MKKLTIFFALMLCVVLAGCNQPATPLSGEPCLSDYVEMCLKLRRISERGDYLI